MKRKIWSGPPLNGMCEERFFFCVIHTDSQPKVEPKPLYVAIGLRSLNDHMSLDLNTMTARLESNLIGVNQCLQLRIEA